LERALERVSQRVIAEHLCVLDNSIGVSVSRLVLTKFQLTDSQKKHESPVSAPEPSPEWSKIRTPLTLAAAASIKDSHVVDVEVEHTMIAAEPTVVDQRGSEVNFGTWD
jgi:hypothetical protein